MVPGSCAARRRAGFRRARFPVEHNATEGSAAGQGSNEYDTAAWLEVVWEVRTEGREPYRFSEKRRAPVWCLKNTFHGKRWYKLRMRGSKGLVPALGVPALVDPANPEKLWIDWDAAYGEHTSA